MPTIFPIGVDGKKDIRDLLRPVIKKRLACVIVDKNEDRGLRHQAINAASVSADPKAISPLVTCLCDEKEETGIREAAALALGSLLSEIPYAEGSNAALGILQGIAQFERDDELQAAANKALEDYERNKVSAVTSEDQIPITGYYVVSSYYPVDIEYMRGAVRTGDIKIQSDMSIAIGFGTDNPPKSVREALEKIADYVIKLRQEYPPEQVEELLISSMGNLAGKYFGFVEKSKFLEIVNSLPPDKREIIVKCFGLLPS